MKKIEVYGRWADTLEELLAHALGVAACRNKGKDQLKRTKRDLPKRVAKCIEVDDGIFEHLFNCSRFLRFCVTNWSFKNNIKIKIKLTTGNLSLFITIHSSYAFVDGNSTIPVIKLNTSSYYLFFLKQPITLLSKIIYFTFCQTQLVYNLHKNVITGLLVSVSQNHLSGPPVLGTLIVYSCCKLQLLLKYMCIYI